MFRILHLLFDSFSCKNLYKDKSLYVEKSLIIKKKKKIQTKKKEKEKKNLGNQKEAALWWDFVSALLLNAFFRKHALQT